MQRSRHRTSRLPAAIVAMAMAAVSGCMTLEQMAPPVDPFLVSVAAEKGHGAESIGRGRQIYLDACVRCHTVEPIGRYTSAKWEQLLPEMTKESKLSTMAAMDVKAYILSSREMLQRPRSVAKSMPLVP